jgi:hypothetical protein
MNHNRPNIGDLVLDGRYSLLREVKGSIGGSRVYLGSAGHCRYCGTRGPSAFRKRAHTFPEALGNKWVFSRDECDACNTKIFSLYDEELAKAVSPFLTLGGVKGKGNKTRATGRSHGRSFMEQRRTADNHRSLVVALNEQDPSDTVTIDPRSGKIRMVTPVAPVPFKPRYAYKALSKMGVALLPHDELPNYRKLIDWLRDPRDNEDFPVLEVALSFGSVGNAPPHAYGALMRRTNATDPVPHILFMFSAGSVCCQIDLLSDHMEDHIPFVPCGAIKIKHNVIVGDETGKTDRTLRIEYGSPVHLNWSSSNPEPQPIERVVLDFDPATCNGHLTPIFRAGGSHFVT